MTVLDLPDTKTVVGEFALAIVLKDDGDYGVEFGMDVIDRETCIGYLTTVVDRLREEVRYSWNTCPGCGEPWEDHEDDDEDEDED